MDFNTWSQTVGEHYGTTHRRMLDSAALRGRALRKARARAKLAITHLSDGHKYTTDDLEFEIVEMVARINDKAAPSVEVTIEYGFKGVTPPRSSTQLFEAEEVFEICGNEIVQDLEPPDHPVIEQ